MRSKRLKRFLSGLVIFLLCISMIVFIPCTPAKAAGPTYYVKNGGNDNAAGTSDATAWATLDRVNRGPNNDDGAYPPGTTILLKKGSVWEHQYLAFKGSGSAGAGNIITVNYYGTAGSKPFIDPYGLNAPFDLTQFIPGTSLQSDTLYKLSAFGRLTNTSDGAYNCGRIILHVYYNNWTISDVKELSFDSTIYEYKEDFYNTRDSSYTIDGAVVEIFKDQGKSVFMTGFFTRDYDPVTGDWLGTCTTHAGGPITLIKMNGDVPVGSNLVRNPQFTEFTNRGGGFYGPDIYPYLVDWEVKSSGGSAAIRLYNQEYITIKNIMVSNWTDKLLLDTMMVGSPVKEEWNANPFGKGSLMGVLLEVNNAGILHDITLDGVEVSGFDGGMEKNFWLSHGIYIGDSNPDIATRIDGLNILNCVVSTTTHSFTGMMMNAAHHSVHKMPGETDSADPRNWRDPSCTIDDTMWTRCRIEGNYFYNIYAYGMVLQYMKDGIVRDNHIDGTNQITLIQGQHPDIYQPLLAHTYESNDCEGVMTNWTWGLVFEGNRIYNATWGQSGEAVNFNHESRDCIGQYNYTEGNSGGTVYIDTSTNYNTVWRYNLSVNDGRQNIYIHYPVHDAKIYNNTFYRNANCDGWGGPGNNKYAGLFSCLNTYTDVINNQNCSIFNNIFWNEGSSLNTEANYYTQFGVNYFSWCSFYGQPGYNPADWPVKEFAIHAWPGVPGTGWENITSLNIHHNLFRGYNETVPASNDGGGNLYTSVPGSAYFTNPVTGDFSLKSTAVNAIGKGVYVSGRGNRDYPGVDITGCTVYDLGAYEYWRE